MRHEQQCGYVRGTVINIILICMCLCVCAGEMDDKPGSPAKSDPMDSASGGETLESREVNCYHFLA